MIVSIDLNPIDTVLGGLRGVLGGAASAAGQAVLDVTVKFVFGLIANAVASITNAIAGAMNTTTGVDFGGGFFPALTPIRQTVLGMSTALILALLFLAIIRSLAAGEPGAIIRAALVDVPAAIMTTVASVTVAWILIRVVDQASLAVTGNVGAAMGKFSASLATVDALSGAGLLGIIFGLLFVVGAILVWLQLLVRSALLYVLVVLAPLGFATRAHPTTRPIARRTIEMGVALILSKFAIAVAFGVGATAIESSTPRPTGGGSGDLGAMMTGVAVMLMAAFMPWVIWKVIPVVEAATAAAGVERAPMRGATAAASTGLAVGMGASRLAGSKPGGGGGGGGGGGVGSSAGGPGGSGAPSGSAGGLGAVGSGAARSAAAAPSSGASTASGGSGAATQVVPTGGSAAAATVTVAASRPAASAVAATPQGAPTATRGER